MPLALPATVRDYTPARLPSLEEVERAHIERVLRETRGNRKAAAEILGIDRGTLLRKIKQYGLVWSE